MMNQPADFSYQKPSQNPASIDDLFTFKINPLTNSNRPGWELAMDVNFSYREGLLPMQCEDINNKERPNQFFKNFFDINQEELSRLPLEVQEYIKGWRTYWVKLGQGAIAGGHYHRLKKEVFTVIDGEFLFKTEDVYGKKKEQSLDKNRGMIMLPFISHEVIGMAPSSTLKVIANSAFNPEDQRTHDTWVSHNEKEQIFNFRKLQEGYKEI